jgi:hypothetical protein
MSPTAIAVVARRVLAKRPWLYWSVVVLAAAIAGASVHRRVERIDAARDAWGTSDTVWVAIADHAPGDTLAVKAREVPRAVVAPSAAHASDRLDGFVTRQAIAAGEIVHETDLVATTGPQAMTPPGWLAVPIVESPGSGAGFGDRVRVVSDGVLIGDHGLVVGHHDDVTLVAVPEDVAPMLSAAAASGAIALLLVP